MLRTYEELIEACLETGHPHHILYVYVKMTDALPAEDMKLLFPDQDIGDVSSLSSIVFDAHEPVHAGLTFEGMVRNADGFCPEWDVVFIMTARNAYDSPITEKQAKGFLKDMRGKIASGTFPKGAPIFDRSGTLKGIDRAEPLHTRGMGQTIN
ncbi:hypothetical protein [Pseudodesulfovibrio piezophilus]|uniref:Uncharacterized protein n=1 Tax=Pseudodesulfovibrio piezophilus (strain DSM 21447 / JCM 15486 / C1TLV30) TaxID=1322246 RepID=M1WQF5_PSEP2|nr:hypothetical protein [Pseudodesulfovibrio piezophilus]CCH48919.1 protein of unknown function [Pseudodesulfovibrio piezophilus C1TLV30]